MEQTENKHMWGLLKFCCLDQDIQIWDCLFPLGPWENEQTSLRKFKKNPRHLTGSYIRMWGACSVFTSAGVCVYQENCLLEISIHRNSLNPKSILTHSTTVSPLGGGCWGEVLWLAAGNIGECVLNQWQLLVACASQWGHVERRRIKVEVNLCFHITLQQHDRLHRWAAAAPLVGCCFKSCLLCQFE